MTGLEAIEYIENGRWSSTRLGLERTRELLARLGDPQRRLKFVHVTGSNGKGSTCAMVESILRRAGFRTGLYTSPYIRDFCERIQVNGENIPGERLGAVTERVRAAAEAMDDHPSQFELVTAAALLYFALERCDIVVLEVGMGGSLDSTNAIDAPEAAVIANIGLEHTEYLGSTIEEIAAVKAGIIKTGCDAVCYGEPPEAVRVVRAVCAERGVRLSCADFTEILPLSRSLDGQIFEWRGMKLNLPLLGVHQLRNAALALETVETLKRRGWNIGPDAVREGLARVRWPARFEVLSREPLFVLDGGHNPQCAEALASVLADYLPGQKLTFLMGVLGDKNYRAMLKTVAPFAAGFVCAAPRNPRALPAEKLAEAAAGLGLEAEACESVADAVRRSLKKGRPVVAFGSLYMAGAVMTEFPRALRETAEK